METSDALKSQINLIVDALVTADPDNRGIYYDNAGNYIYNLENVFDKYASRIQEYNYSPFITIGKSYSDFVELYELDKYHIAHYDTLEAFIADKKWEDEQNKNIIKTIFAPTIPALLREEIQNNY